MKAYCTVFTFLFSVFVFGGACAAMREFKSANRGDVLNLYDMQLSVTWPRFIIMK